MNTPRTALEEWSELSENCTQGRFVARADGLIIADCDDHSYEVGVTPGWNRHDRELVVSAINLLRTHGKALSEALEDAERYRFLRSMESRDHKHHTRGALSVAEVNWGSAFDPDIRTDMWSSNECVEFAMDEAVDKARGAPPPTSAKESEP